MSSLAELVRNGIMMGLLVLPVLLGCWWRRAGGLIALAFVLAALTVAHFLEILTLSSWEVWLQAFPLWTLLRVAGWLLAGWLLIWVGGIRTPIQGALGAFLGAMVAGGPAAGLALGNDRPAVERARLILVALGASLCAPLGSPLSWMLGGPELIERLWPLGLLLALVAWPWRAPASGSLLAVAPALLVLPASFFWPDASLIALIVALAALALLRPGPERPPVRLSIFLWLPSVAFGALLLKLAGPLDLLANSLYDADIMIADLLPLSLGLGAMLVAGIGNAAAAAFLVEPIAQGAPVDFNLHLRAVVTAGAVVGSGLPVLALAGREVLRAGIMRWALMVLLTLCYIYFS